MGIKSFTIKGELPSMNEIIAAAKKHYIMYSKMKKKYTGLVADCSEGLSPLGKVDIEITWYCKNKRKDKDNIIAGQKFILDGLVESGVIKNDGWSEVGNIFHVFGIDKRSPRIEVRLKEVE